ncbi:hypothetical protein LOTGIDRAFT_171633 [Lottia gigantea]|uniref:DNA-directed DNA polymerase n=1 Tax=Lottia gigantea TaxID=225164 RepID=V4BB74_LOTGI|nr:hypothetical protein LOTGIDRAFT_171633 [Lottia gigantea]ESP03287.1 hypothetical protein LOTGIDRAFT_171633 [Lottia gigantea]
MTTARICEFNKKFNTYFQIYMPKHRHFQRKKVSKELDWVFYLHKSHFCLIRRNNKTLGITEIEDNYDENEWRTCRDDNAVTQVSPLKLNVFPTMHNDCLYAWDCESYSEKETNKAIPYSCTLINLEKLRKLLDRIKHNFPHLNPTDSVPKEFYNKLMNIVEIFVGKDCIDQMLQRLGKIDQKRLTLISDNEVLTSVDIQEIVKAGGRIIRMLDGIVYEEYRDYILILIDLRNKYKREGNIVGSNCMKLLGNSLYGKSIQKDITTSRHLWSEATLKANFDSHVKSYPKVNETQYIVEINEEEKEFDCTPPKSTRLTPSQLGSFVLSHSKKIMNNFIHVIDGFYKPEICYTDTDSLYISSSNWDKLNETGLVSENDYCKGKNDYGDGGIIYGLYLAPKVKYNIIVTSDGILKEKKTFKGYSNDKIAVEDYIRLASGHDVTNEFKKPWEKSFTNGVVILKDDDKQMQVFRSYLNLVKRKAPGSEEIMYPYSDKDDEFG